MSGFTGSVLLAAAASILMFGGCSKKAVEAKRDIRPIAAAYYRAHPDFFRYKTLADLPKGLVWHDGKGVPEFGDPAAKRGGTLRSALPDFPRTLRFYGPDAAEPFRAFILDDDMIPLVERQPNTGQDYPGLARQWAYAPDGRTMVFRLDPAARYSDGVPVRVDDFFFAFFLYRSSYIQDPWMNNYFSQNFTQITKYDDLTFSVSWTQPKPDLDDKIAGPNGLVPEPEHFFKDLGPDYPQRYQWRVEPTTGPYTVRPEDVHKGSWIDVTRVPHWWAADKRFFRHRYNVDRFHFTIIRDPDKMVEAFKRGDIDVLELDRPELWYDKLPNDDPLVRRGAVAKFTFYNQVPRATYGLYLNCSDPLLANRDVRRGIAYASNFDLIDRRYYRGDWTRMQTSADGYADVPFPGIHPRPFSVAKALVCFAQAGFVKRGPDGILVDGRGRRLSFTITTPYEAFRDPLTILRQEAAKAGLEFKIEILDETTAFKKIDEKHAQIAFVGIDTAATPERYPRYWENFASVNANRPTTNNFTDTVDPVMDRLIAAYDRARTMDEVRRLARRLELRIRYDAAFIPAFEYTYFRGAYWRWVRFPANFATRESISVPGWNGLDFGLCWIDDSVRPAVLAAAHGGPPLPPDIKAYDRYRERPETGKAAP
ncbi:MAG: extracellular solute-binding protein [Opitutaceae bacterium]